MKLSGIEIRHNTLPVVGMAGITHVANIFKGLKHHVASPCSVW